MVKTHKSYAKMLKARRYYHIKWADTNTERASLIRVIKCAPEEYKIMKLADNWSHGG